MAITRIFEMLLAVVGSAPHFPPTELYNEGWLARLVMDWFSTHAVPGHALNFAPQARWFSEALLPSAFAPRFRGDPLGEARTHADGVVGHFRIGAVGTADLSLASDATQLVIVEAKLFANLAAGIAHAPYFDQAARNIACLVEILKRAQRPASSMGKIGFCVLAPQAAITKGGLEQLLKPGSIQGKVAQRVAAYTGAKEDWFLQWFQPTFPRIDLHVLSWESLLDVIRGIDSPFGHELADFYQKALRFNSKPLGNAPV